MEKDSNEKKTDKQAAIDFLNTLITIRNAPLLILGLTTITLVYPTTTGWCVENLGDTFFSRMAANIVTMLVYMMLDGLLEIVLNYIDDQETEGRSVRYYAFVVLVGCVALAGSGTLSIWSAPIIVALTDNTGNIGKDTKRLAEMKLRNDSIAIASRGAIVAQALESEGARMENARKQAQALEKAAAKTSHASWYSDYLAAKNNSSHWLWTCTGGSGCPREYRQYRDRILAARQEGARIIADAQGLVTTISGNSSASDDRFVIDAIKSASKADSVLLARNEYLFNIKRKALVSIEIGCMIAVIFITIMIVAGKKVHNVTLDREFITLFSVIRTTVDKVITTLYYVYSALIDAIHPRTLQNMVMIPVEAAGHLLGRKARETRERLAIAEEERRKAEDARKDAERKAEEQRQALELERQALERQRQEEKRAMALEKARQEREKMEAEARERARKEAEEARMREREREKERERQRREDAQNKARKEKPLQPVEKKVKDSITNAIRYQFKRMETLDARKDAEVYSECKAKINEIIADKLNGLAFLESRGYTCRVDWEKKSVSAKAPK